MPKTNLKLGSLGYAAVGAGPSTSMGAITGGNPNTAMSDFAFDSVTVTHPFTYIVEGTTEQLKFVFAQSGSRFNTYNKGRGANYVVTTDNEVFFSTAYNPTAGVFDITAKNLGTAPYSGSSATLLSAKYNDGFNINATGYNVASTKNIYSVDTYNQINSDTFCVDVDTQILLANGSTISAVDLYIGDTIKTFVPTDMPEMLSENDEHEWYWWFQNNISGEVVDATIGNIYYSFADSYVSINNDALKCTKAHPLFVFDSDNNTYQFSRAEDLVAGDKLIKYNQTTSEIEEILVESVNIINDTLEIATITVDVAHTYLANGFVSHNKGTESTPPVPHTGLRMYLDPSKSTSFTAGRPSTGTPSVDLLDVSGWNTGVRPAGQAPRSLASGNPSYNNGASSKERYYSLNGTTQMFYKDFSSNINGNLAQFNVTTGTIHVWVRPTTTLGESERILFDMDGRYSLGIGSTDSSTLNRINFDSTSMGTFSIPTYTMPLNTWTMVTVAFNANGSVEAYANGGFQLGYGTSSQTIPSLDGLSYLTIGGSSGFGRKWNGQIGPVLFYNVKQNSSQIAAVFNSFSPIYT